MGEDEVQADFYQPDWQIAGDVYNVKGQLLLSKSGTAADFLRALSDLRDEIALLPDLESDRRAEVEADIAAVAREATKAEPAGGVIIARLKAIQAGLEAAGGAASSALGIAGTVAKMVAWAARFFS